MSAVQSSRSAFTLVESVFAATLVSVVILGSIALLSRDMEVSKSSISVQVAQNQAQTLIYALEKELSNARGERPVATLTSAIGSGTLGSILLDSSAGFPPAGTLTIERGRSTSSTRASRPTASRSRA